MDKVWMKKADLVLMEAMSTWWAGRLEEDSAIREAMDEIVGMSGEHSDDVSSLLYDIISRASDIAAEAAIKNVL